MRKRCPISTRPFWQALRNHKRKEKLRKKYLESRSPTINAASDAIVHDLFADCLEVSYYSKREVFDFE